MPIFWKCPCALFTVDIHFNIFVRNINILNYILGPLWRGGGCRQSDFDCGASCYSLPASVRLKNKVELRVCLHCYVSRTDKTAYFLHIHPSVRQLWSESVTDDLNWRWILHVHIPLRVNSILIDSTTIKLKVVMNLLCTTLQKSLCILSMNG